MLEQIRSGDHLAQNRTRTQELDAKLPVRSLAKQVEPLEDALQSREEDRRQLPAVRASRQRDARQPLHGQGQLVDQARRPGDTGETGSPSCYFSKESAVL